MQWAGVVALQHTNAGLQAAAWLTHKIVKPFFSNQKGQKGKLQSLPSDLLMKTLIINLMNNLHHRTTQQQASLESHLEKLWCQMCNSPTAAAIDDIVLVTQQLCQSKVRQLCDKACRAAAVTFEQDIVWLDVAVQQLHVVEVVHTSCHLDKHLQGSREVVAV